MNHLKTASFQSMTLRSGKQIQKRQKRDQRRPYTPCHKTAAAFLVANAHLRFTTSSIRGRMRTDMIRLEKQSRNININCNTFPTLIRCFKAGLDHVTSWIGVRWDGPQDNSTHLCHHFVYRNGVIYHSFLSNSLTLNVAAGFDLCGDQVRNSCDSTWLHQFITKMSNMSQSRPHWNNVSGFTTISKADTKRMFKILTKLLNRHSLDLLYPMNPSYFRVEHLQIAF